MKILVVDENPNSKRNNSIILRRNGHKTELAGSGMEALAILEEDGEITAILLETQMQLMGGLEVLSLLRGKYSKEELPIIMTATEDGKDLKKECLEAGANRFLIKPIGPNDLLEAFN